MINNYKLYNSPWIVLYCVVIIFPSFSYYSVFFTLGRRFVKKNTSKCTSKTQPIQRNENTETNQPQEAPKPSVTAPILQIKTEPEDEGI